MIHMYAVVLAVILLVGALVAIIICICVDIVPIIKSRGSTLVSRDSVTQEQSRLLKKSLQRTQLTSSASADFADCGQGRKSLAQALRKSERPRFGSTPLCLLTGEDDKNSDGVEYKTTTVIIEALPKKSTENNNNNNDETIECDVTNDITSPEGDNRQSSTNSSSATPQQQEVTKHENKVQSTAAYVRRAENIYTDDERRVVFSDAENSRMQETKAISGSLSNISNRRTKSVDLQGPDPIEVRRSSMTYNARETQLKMESDIPRSYPNSPNIRNNRASFEREREKDTKEKAKRNTTEEQRTHVAVPRVSGTHVSGRMPEPPGCYPDITGRASELSSRASEVISRGPDMYIGSHGRGDQRRNDTYSRQDGSSGYRSGTPSSCTSQCCKWCHIERERALKDSAHERHLPFRRTESFPENYAANSSPQISHRQLRRQHSLEEDPAVAAARVAPYERQYGRGAPHPAYAPCPECCHSNHPVYYPYSYHGDHTYPDMVPGVPGVRNSPKNGPCLPPGQYNHITSSSSSSTSSGSSSRFRHLRQPLEDIQEDASDYVMGGDITSTIDSRELDSCVDDDIRPKSQGNSIMSVSPLSLSDKQPSFIAASGS